jgi:hypothetical protein
MVYGIHDPTLCSRSLDRHILLAVSRCCKRASVAFDLDVTPVGERRFRFANHRNDDPRDATPQWRPGATQPCTSGSGQPDRIADSTPISTGENAPRWANHTEAAKN